MKPTRKLTEKGREYELSKIDYRRKKTASSLTRKSDMIDEILYSSTNASAEQLNQLDDLFQKIESIQKEMITLDTNYNDDGWFDQLDEKVFSIKYKIHGWLKDVEKESEAITTASKRRATSRCSRGTSSKRSSGKTAKSSRSSSGRCNTSIKDQAIIKKMKVAELLAEQKYIERRKAAEYGGESLRIQQKVEKAKARAEVLDEEIKNENTEERKPDHRENRIHSRCRYEDDQNLKEQVHWPENLSRKGTRLSYDTLVNIKTNAQKFNYEEISLDNSRVNRGDKICTKKAEPTNLYNQTATDVLCQLLKKEAVPEVDIEVFDGNLLNFKYFISLFKENVEMKLDDPRGRLTHLIKYMSGEAKELVKNCLYLPGSEGYKEAIRMMNERYGDPHKILAAYRKEIKDWPIVKAVDISESKRFFNFLIKCRSLV